ncbi:T9SS type A sorting domain-containing protein [candidate division KSB1 bacterium]|nr:T9SS type A sorting domain-containing protein [candidate division KSB1 bacterium]
MQVIAVDLQENAAQVKSWAISKQLSYPILLDNSGSIWNQYGMGYIPHNVIIDQNFIVQYTNYDYEEAKLIRIIDSLIPTAVDKNDANEKPVGFALHQNYPNPFNSSTEISYDLPVSTHITLKIYDILGKEIRTLVNETQPANHYKINWDGKNSAGNDVPSGIYFYRMTAPTFSQTQKLSMMR